MVCLYSHLFCRGFLFHLYSFTYTDVHHDFHITWCSCCLTITRQLALVEQELHTLTKHMSWSMVKYKYLHITIDRSKVKYKYLHTCITIDRSKIKYRYLYITIARSKVKYKYLQITIYRPKVKYKYLQITIDRSKVKYKYLQITMDRSNVKQIQISTDYNR